MTVETWSVLVGALLPALVAFINRAAWDSWIKALVALGSSVLAGTVTALLSGEFTGTTWITAIGVVFGAAQVSYITWWKNSGISNMIEQKANVIPAGPKEIATESKKLGTAYEGSESNRELEHSTEDK